VWPFLLRWLTLWKWMYSFIWIDAHWRADEKTQPVVEWVGFHVRPPLTLVNSFWYSLNRLLGCFHSLSGRFGEGRNSLLLSEIEPRYFSHLIHNLFIHNEWEIPRPTAYGHKCKKMVHLVSIVKWTRKPDNYTIISQVFTETWCLTLTSEHKVFVEKRLVKYVWSNWK